MERYLLCAVLCLLGLGFMRTEAFEVTVKDESKTTCIYASMQVNFAVQYDTNNGTKRNTTFAAPDNVTTDGSRCGSSGVDPLLVVNFGNNHSWSVNFTSDSTVYRIGVIVFTYNTNDSTLFPDAKEKGLLTAVKTINDSIPMNTTYVCIHEEVLTTENVVQVYRNVTLLPYGQDAKKEFHCSADTPTPQPPTTHPVTTANVTVSPAPTTKPVDKPSIGHYNISRGNETCLLASMGLQLNATLLIDGKRVWTPININPNSTVSSGICSNGSALLRLSDSGATVVEFYFSIKEKNFYLKEVNVTLTNGSGISYITNSNLSLWEASMGYSYLCHKEQLITVSEDLSINTFDVRVQPFNVQNATYAIASECSLDDDSILIPIIVGAALAGLIVIVVIAYLIGRRKTYAGYQTL
ncbi:lysosome-associated membrane glycoprotein 2 isoform X2 [Eleutherodactylus coqui]|uniref:lysosome-associated membrane glycoprotein 2 isoform X2 n=1 Tax=Eleutherodactylus coqui TaxID=57060 RepID=UPI003461F6C2